MHVFTELHVESRYPHDVLRNVLQAAAVAGARGWAVWRGTERTTPAPARPAITSWKGGQSQTCTVTVNGASLADDVPMYNVVMVCGVGRGDRDRLTDRAITVSDATVIQPRDFVIEEAVSGPMRVLLEELAGRDRSSSPPDAQRVHEEALWYELVLLPTSVDALAVSTIADVERLGGRRLSKEPHWTVITVRP